MNQQTMKEPIVFLRGEFLPASQAQLNIYDYGVVMGATFTEMARTFNGELFRVDDHLTRLFSSLEYGGIVCPLTPEELRERIIHLANENWKLLESGQDLAVVCFVTAGENAIYAGRAGRSTPLVPTLCVHSFPVAFTNYQDFYVNGAGVAVPEIRHIPPACLDPRSKHRSRLHWFLADKQARQNDASALALLLDLSGNITECAGANFLICKDRTIYSPDSRAVLGGISLQTVREIAAELKLDWIEKDLRVEDVFSADESWLTSTPYCIAPCTRLNNKAIGDGEIGPVFREILKRWSARVGLDIEKQIRNARY